MGIELTGNTTAWERAGERSGATKIIIIGWSAASRITNASTANDELPACWPLETTPLICVADAAGRSSARCAAGASIKWRGQARPGRRVSFSAARSRNHKFANYLLLSNPPDAFRAGVRGEE
jgi:hypothetical protein